MYLADLKVYRNTRDFPHNEWARVVSGDDPRVHDCVDTLSTAIERGLAFPHPGDEAWSIGMLLAFRQAGGSLRDVDRAFVWSLLAPLHHTPVASEPVLQVLHWFAFTGAADLLPDSAAAPDWARQAESILAVARTRGLRDLLTDAVDPVAAVLAGLLEMPVYNRRQLVVDAAREIEELVPALYGRPGVEPWAIDTVRLWGVHALAAVEAQATAAEVMARLIKARGTEALPIAPYTLALEALNRPTRRSRRAHQTTTSLLTEGIQ